MKTENEEGHGVPDDKAHGHCGCGDDAEQKALHELEEAKAEVDAAGVEMKHALHDVEDAERKLEKAEHDLEEARKHPHIIHFSVDGEDYETTQREWTPNAIIKEFGGRDPATNYLVQIEGQKKISYQGKGDTQIELHDCERFQVISTGPTPVSDGGVRTGVDAFVAGLVALGYNPTVLRGTLDHVVFDYTVESGSHAGKRVRHGFIVPPDFPMTAPSGPHVSPRIHPFQNGGTHPSGGVLQQSGAFETGVGGEWQYWSRPFNQWGTAKKSVATYLSHIWRLWDSQ